MKEVVIGAPALQNVSGRMGQTISRGTSSSLALRGWLNRNGPDPLASDILELSIGRISQTKRAGQSPPH
eukprot:8618303-Pyramimonas_sp.AAC.1